MKIIGITGGTGAGKSSVCDEFKKYGAQIVDADLIARQIVRFGQPALDEIVSFFGKEILTDDGELNRKKMGSIVFSDKNKLNILNNITHKYIFAEMKRQMDESNAEILVLDVPLLFQDDFPFECDMTVAVVADTEERIRRIMSRDGISKDAAEARVFNQLSDDEYRNLADVCFENNGDVEEIKEFVKKLCIE